MIWVWRILLTVCLMLVGVAFALLASFWWPMWIITALVFLPVVVVSAVVLFSQYFEIERI